MSLAVCVRWAIVAIINDRIVNLPDKVVQEEALNYDIGELERVCGYLSRFLSVLIQFAESLAEIRRNTF